MLNPSYILRAVRAARAEITETSKTQEPITLEPQEPRKDFSALYKY